MSGLIDGEAAKTLEDLFLSHEFGRALGSITSPESDAHHLTRPPRLGRLTPMMATSRADHDTTTHLRRVRAAGVVSGVAAALLIAVGLGTNPALRNSPGITSALSKPSGASQPTGGSALNPSTGASAASGLVGSGGVTPSQLTQFSGVNAASAGSTVQPAATATLVSTGGPSTTNGAGATSPVSPVNTGSPSTVTPPPAQPPPPAKTGVGVTSVETHLKQVVTRSGKAVPPLAPVTGALSSIV